MQVIHMKSDEKSFIIYSKNGVKEYFIQEKLFLRQGNINDCTGKIVSFDEYKIRVLIDIYGTIRTYHARFILKKKEWYITSDCSELTNKIK